MSVALQAIDGIESATVSLNEGVATITLAAANQVTVAQVREVVRDNGFSPKATEVRLLGRIADSAEGVTLTLPHSVQAYLLRDHDESAGAIERLRAAGLDREVVVEGVVPESEPGVDERILLLRRFFDSGASD